MYVSASLLLIFNTVSAAVFSYLLLVPGLLKDKAKSVTENRDLYIILLSLCSFILFGTFAVLLLTVSLKIFILVGMEIATLQPILKVVLGFLLILTTGIIARKIMPFIEEKLLFKLVGNQKVLIILNSLIFLFLAGVILIGGAIT